ncbi:hypothetical protein CCACVL1_30187 [Corchorus capsularis]|uniref:Uncharacterized protein n=1 Tax=Corchorus capsularis TaxID=210143 RepID=A0A1R3FYF5_COCAP|nr:hypothetical protein CCACVL1_30187 [Corchorus capsularis]
MAVESCNDQVTLGLHEEANHYKGSKCCEARIYYAYAYNRRLSYGGRRLSMKADTFGY